MDDGLSNASSPSSSESGSLGVSDNDCFSDYDGSPGTPLSSPEQSNECLPEPKSLLSQYTNIELGVVASLDRRDDFLVTLAVAKRSIAKAERKLAHSRVKEVLVLHRLQRVREEIARSRLSQANINIKRAKFYHKRLSDQPRLAGNPEDILSTLAKPSFDTLETLVEE